MKAFIVYCHPSEDSFTRNVRDAFIKGITDAGNEYILSDLYKDQFKTDMTEAEYLRDAYYRNTPVCKAGRCAGAYDVCDYDRWNGKRKPSF